MHIIDAGGALLSMDAPTDIADVSCTSLVMTIIALKQYYTSSQTQFASLAYLVEFVQIVVVRMLV